MDIIIRQAVAKEIPMLAKFLWGMEKELNGLDLRLGECETVVSRIFYHPQEGRYFVAEECGTVVGSLLVRPEWDQLRKTMTWWINDVYVNPLRRNRGVMSALFAEIIELSEKEQLQPTLKLNVALSNAKAEKLYSEIGFIRRERTMEYIPY